MHSVRYSESEIITSKTGFHNIVFSLTLQLRGCGSTTKRGCN